tara:strand:+ start:1415 stop:1573 length:159 start_codon:yes stop_codon:yes gene_type:complete
MDLIVNGIIIGYLKKNLEKDKWTSIEEWNDIDKTIELIHKTHENYLQKTKLK